MGVATKATEPALADRLLPTTKGSAQYAETLAEKQRTMPVAGFASKQWVASRSVAVQSDEMLPQIFYQSFKLNFDQDAGADAGRVPIHLIADRLSRITGIPVRIKSDVVTSSMSNSVALSSSGSPGAIGGPLPAGGIGGLSNRTSTSSQDPNSMRALEMRWDGTLSGFLDNLSARLGIGWAYRDGAVVLERYQTETFEIAALQAAQNFSFNMNGTSSGNSGSSNNASTSSSGLNVDESGKMESLQSLGKTIGSMVANVPGSSVTLAEGTGSLVVTTTKDAMGRVRDVIKRENASMMRAVQLQFDIYSVTVDNSTSAGVNWTGLFEKLSDNIGGTMMSPAGSVSGGGSIQFNVLSGGNTDAFFKTGSQAIVAALAKFGNSVQHRPVSLITLNRQWARKTNLRQTGYLQETTPSAGGGTNGGGMPGLKTGTVTTGDTFAVQPAILDGGAILLKFGVGLTDLLGLFDVTSGSGVNSQRVQTPEVSGTNDQATVPLQKGEALILTGMSRTRASTNRTSMGENIPVFAGGKRGGSEYREEFIIIVRPVVL
jgi:type IVB pilus formation R64 PilN family outer membrane protein